MVALYSFGVSTVLFLSLIFCGLHTVQGISNYGTEFNIGFTSTGEANYTLSLRIQAQVNGTSISISALNGYLYEGTVNNNGPFNVDLPFQIVEEPSFNFRNLGFKIISTSPISVIVLSCTGNQPNTILSSFLALPYIEYPAINKYTYYGISSYYSSSSASTLLLVGNRDNTSITIIPTLNITLPTNIQSNDSTNITIASGQTYTVILNSLQTLVIVSSEGDLTGTKIISNKPLTVIGGQDCFEEECSSLATQIAPTITWGKRFLLPVLTDRQVQYTVISSEPNTVITCHRNATLSSQIVSLSAAGERWSFIANSTHGCGLLSCDQRCYVVMFTLTESNSTVSSIVSILPTVQYPTTPSSLIPLSPTLTYTYYTVIIPMYSGEYFNRTLLINGLSYTPNWSPIYATNGTISGYSFNDVFNTSITISRPNMGPLFVTVYGSEGTYGYTAGTLLVPLFPRVIITPQDGGCVLDGSDWTIVTLSRLSDFDINFILKLTSPSTNFTEVQFLSGEVQKIVNISLMDTQMDLIELTAVVDSVNNSIINLAQTILTVQETEGITVGFTGPQNRSVLRVDNLEVTLEVQLGGNELKCLTNDSDIIVLLQLVYGQGNVINVTQFQFNRYVTTYSVQVKLPQRSFNEDMISGRLILISNAGIDITTEQSQIIITLMNPSTSLPTLSSTLPSPTPTRNLVDTTLLNPATAYTIAISSTLLTGVLCLFVALASFGCGRFCRNKKHESFNTHTEGLPERPGHYNIINKPFNLTSVATTHVISDGGFANRHRADSQRRPPPAPPANRPLPLLPHESEIHVNQHNDENEETI